ncbi:unnamed protein product [Paramecium sonneborni]|uniref:Uncharacterized protein n=1 Tax=Paramecium sonneborni TaxID=65129 RepID=A0A8S1KGR5_9CILI|nr:unnamed protein product [Paramecium sonneborni]
MSLKVYHSKSKYLMGDQFNGLSTSNNKIRIEIHLLCISILNYHQPASCYLIQVVYYIKSIH